MDGNNLRVIPGGNPESNLSKQYCFNAVVTAKLRSKRNEDERKTSIWGKTASIIATIALSQRTQRSHFQAAPQGNAG